LFKPFAEAERKALRASSKLDDRFVFLNVSAQTRSKGTDLLLKAFARVATKHPEALLVLKGSDGIYRSGNLLQRWVSEVLTQEERQAIKGRVRYLGGSLPVGKLASIYQTADVYVTPYRSESFNLPAIEAVASGLPIIATAGGPTDEYTTPDCAVRIGAELVPGTRPNELIRRPNLDELTDAMLDIIGNPGFRETARQAGPAHVDANFTWRHTVDRLLAVARDGK
jgi:glycosyltransferase involved in cell wall biosynthesis